LGVSKGVAVVDWVGLEGTHPIQVALPKKSSMKAMMTKMPQPVMLACALGGCAWWEVGYWQGCTMGRWFWRGRRWGCCCRRSWTGTRKEVFSTVGDGVSMSMVGEKCVSAGP